jgi:fluoride ion exporter CrcB/FEX
MIFSTLPPQVEESYALSFTHYLWHGFNQLPAWLLLSLGACLGAFARYGFTRLFALEWQGILGINLLGCLGFGIGLGLTIALPERFGTPTFRLFFLTGCMGAMTTFSSYMFNVYQAVSTSPSPAWGTLLVNIAVQHGLGLALLAFGVWIVPRVLIFLK